MKAVILVGGEGTRLRPLTYHVPKPLLPVVGSTILQHVLTHLAEHGVTDAVLSLGYKPEPFLRAFPDNMASGVRLSYATEPEPLDTAGAIAFAARQAGWQNETLVVVNGDVITDNDVTALIAMHNRVGALATISLTPVDDPSRFGVVPTQADGQVIAFIEKPPVGEAPTNMINAGTYVLAPEVIAMVEAGRRVSIEREIFPAIVAKGACYGLADDSYWVDAGTPEMLLRVNVDLLNGSRRSDAAQDSVFAQSSSILPVDLDAQHVAIGADVVIGNAVVLRDVVLMDGAVIGDGANISQSIVAGRVGEGARLAEWCVVGRDGVVAPGAMERGSKIPAV